VSHDIRTMPRHFQEFIRKQASPGLILVPQRLALGAAIEELLLFWIASEDHEWINRSPIFRFELLQWRARHDSNVRPSA